MIWGPMPLADGGTRFTLWAPGQAALGLQIEGRPSLPMVPGDAGWFACDTDAGPGTLYRFVLDDGTAVPDPASRLQGPDVHDASIVVDPAHDWQHRDWAGRPWEDAVIYELHVGAMGGYAGVAAALPRLAALGITAIELMPLADFSGTRNWGYDGVLPFAPDSSYGTPAELKALIDRAHGLGLMVFLDVVYNHFGPDGNYLAAYAPDFFTPDVPTPWGPAIDFAREPVARFFIDNALYWLTEYRFDGLRFDAVHAIADPGFLDRLAGEIRATIAPGRHVHLMLENERNDARRLERGYDAQWNDDFHNVLHVLLTDEHHAYYADFADRATERLARCLAEGFIYQGEGSPNHDGRPRGMPSAHLPPTRFVAFLQNHDQIGNRALGERLTRLVAPDRLRAATGLLLLCPQIPLLFMGDETGSQAPFLFFTDFHDALADAVRNGRRAEFAKFPAFADPEQRARIPDPNDPATFAASRPTPGPDADAWTALYTDLLAIRRNHIVPHLPGCTELDAAVLGDKAVLARWRLGQATLTLALNIGDAPVPLAAPAGDCVVTIGDGIADGRLAPATFVGWIGE
ncbi:MAG TPA: malto-oligosyltrehalose trehalohydrolase [Sphingomonas sp.]|jgi:maltooligosyltrehalose trehalohydrolase|uniref:malto-oligosyltrehalose trehalohydrolase n=1 Tax=Sphingomonas sp. TaxID=28214 RepID=UPI002ED99572